MRVSSARSSVLSRFISPVPVVYAGLVSPAWAGPPVITCQAIVGQIPGFEIPLRVNLRQQGVISGRCVARLGQEAPAPGCPCPRPDRWWWEASCTISTR